MATSAETAASLNGRVLGGGAPVANSTVTLWAANAGAPKQLSQVKTGADGRFTMPAPANTADSSLYLIARGGQSGANKASGDNPAISLLTVLGSKPPARVTINEMTTVASVVTHNQYIVGTVIKGSPLALRIPAGNVPNFVDLATGGYGSTILDALNSAQTPTMANFRVTPVGKPYIQDDEIEAAPCAQESRHCRRRERLRDFRAQLDEQGCDAR